MAEISLAGEGVNAPSRRVPPFASLTAALAAESERRILWLPVWFGSGIAVYFALTVEPPIWLGPAIMLSAIAAAILLRRRPVWRGAAVSLAFAAAGFALITETTRERAAPMLDRRLGPVAITGGIVDIDTLDRGWRIVVAPDSLPGLDPAQQPRFLRIHITAASDLLSPGDRTSLRGMLY